MLQQQMEDAEKAADVAIQLVGIYGGNGDPRLADAKASHEREFQKTLDLIPKLTAAQKACTG